MSEQPVPQPAGGRGRIPPRPPTAVGLMERPEPGPPAPRARAGIWQRFARWVERATGGRIRLSPEALGREPIS
jgi:hypothetical protein